MPTTPLRAAPLVALLILTTAVGATEEEVVEAFSWQVLLGMLAGITLPILLLQKFQNLCGEPMSTVSEVSEESIQRYLATGKPAVVMVHCGSDLESTQGLMWTLMQLDTYFQQNCDPRLRADSIDCLTVDSVAQHRLASSFQVDLTNLPILLWLPGSTMEAAVIPLFSDNIMRSAGQQQSWIVSWIDSQYQEKKGSDSELRTVTQLFVHVYSCLDGFDTAESELLQVDNAVHAKSWISRLFSAGHDASVYGEILPHGIQGWLHTLNSCQDTAITTDSVVYDLGSGTGKVVLQLCIQSESRKVVGIELGHSRHQHALKAVEKVRKLAAHRQAKTSGDESLIDCAKRLMSRHQDMFVLGDIAQPIYKDGTDFIAASTCYPAKLMSSIVRNLVLFSEAKTFATLKPIPAADLQRYRTVVSHWKTIQVAVSWQAQSRCFIYKFDRSHLDDPRLSLYA